MSSITPLSIPNSGTMHVIIMNRANGHQRIRISVGTETYYDNDNIDIGYDFGFFTNHYSHGCSSIGQFSLTNINIKYGENS